MYIIRDVFRCKPGKVRPMVEKLRAVAPLVERDDGFRNTRIFVDMVATYWSVVLQSECETMAQFEKHMAGYHTRPDVQAAMAGYLEFVESGHREVWRDA